MWLEHDPLCRRHLPSTTRCSLTTTHTTLLYNVDIEKCNVKMLIRSLNVLYITVLLIGHVTIELYGIILMKRVLNECQICEYLYPTSSKWSSHWNNSIRGRTASSRMLRRVALVRTDVSEVLSASFISVKIIGELGTKLAVTSLFPSPPFIFTLMKEALSTSETSVLTRATQR
jgi:hypothetical protein